MPAHETENAKQIACADILPDCPFTASAATEEELLNKVAAHAEHEHGITDVTPEPSHSTIRTGSSGWRGFDQPGQSTGKK